ncbi:MAG TPA: UbiA family prenyltransferase [Bryobacteraceae bacterium]|nr:UbiA family prenyltransferase [Bryobacteraceae bacterium]
MVTHAAFTETADAGEETKGLVPLCVDLDGTLIRTDLLWESLLLLVRQNFWALFLLPLWALRGKAILKHEIARRVQLDVASLPYNGELLEWIFEQRQLGRSTLLVTASNEKLAREVSDYLGCFDEVLASTEEVNLKGRAKQAALTERFGRKQFDYAGNSRADVSVWRQSQKAIVVNASAKTAIAAQKVSPVARIFPRPGFSLRTWLRAARVHQWVKNLLVFVPLFTSHRFAELQSVQATAVLFCAFSLCASVIYVMNDLLDLTSDRNHATKSKRPFASGALSIPQGIALGIGMFGASVVLALFLPMQSRIVLGFYLVLTSLYSIRLKQKLILDVLTLAALYTLRIVAGAVSTGTKLSHWLVAFSLFFFLSLGICKRSSELMNLLKANRTGASGRFYETGDLEPLNICGICSGVLACLILLLYSTSAQATLMYSTPALLLLLCPLLFYWLSRVWILTFRGRLNEDPILFAVHDRTSYAVSLCVIAIVLAAEFLKLPINQFLD